MDECQPLAPGGGGGGKDAAEKKKHVREVMGGFGIGCRGTGDKLAERRKAGGIIESTDRHLPCPHWLPRHLSRPHCMDRHL